MARDGSEEMLRALVQHMPESVAIYDRTARVLYANEATATMFGSAAVEMTGRVLWEMFPEAIGNAFHAAFERVAAGGGPESFDHYYAPWNRWFSNRIERDGERIQVVARDVTEQRRATSRMERLLTVAALLAAADHREEIARAVVDEGLAALDASLAAIWFISDDGTELVVARTRGFRPEHASAFERIPVGSTVPLANCVETRQPVWVSSRAEYATRYPALEAETRPVTVTPVAFGCLPLMIEDDVVGAMMIGFHDEPRIDVDERTFFEVLATGASEALRRTRLYAELREASETRRAIIQASPAAIQLIDADGVVRLWNPASERMFGWTADEAIGCFHPAIGAEHRRSFLDNLAHVHRGNAISGQETRRMRSNGETFDVELYAAPVESSSGEMLCVAMVVDASERKRLERGRQLVTDAAAELARSLAWESTTAAVVQLVVRDLADWSCIDLHEGEYLRRIALSRAQLADNIPVPTRLAHDPERGGASGAIETGITQLLQDINEEDTEKLARDHAHHAAIRALGMRSLLSVPMKAGTRTIGAFSFASTTRNFDDVDIAIANQLASQTAMAIDNARLYQQAEEARREAESASRAKDDFLAMLGHELRNPLAPIGAALELLKLRAPGQSSEREVIARQVTHLTRLVDDLLDVSRIGQGKIRLQTSRVMVASFVARAIEMARHLIETRRHRLTTSVPDDLAVDGDPTRLAQIVSNLLTNAARYTEIGGHIELTATRDADCVLVRVKDTGMGIAPEVLPRIFEMFVQAPQSLARTSGGLGLGLTIVHNLVTLHGGTVVARSEGLGRGTELEVRLPLATSKAATAVSVGARLERSARPRRVLIVDDNEDAAMLLAELLAQQGHQIRTAFDGRSALVLANDFRPEIAVLDLGLPQMDGYELARRLRDHPDHRDLRLVAVTGYSQASDHARSRAAGFDLHLAKPVEIDALMRFVDAV